jgi:hypothetical protein
MRIRDQEYGVSLDLEHRYPYQVKFSFVEVGPAEPENPRHADLGAEQGGSAATWRPAVS